MSDLRVSNLKGRTAGSSPVLPDGIRVTGIGTFSSDVEVAGNLNVTGDLVYDEATAVNLKISGIATVGSAVTMSVAGIHVQSGIVTANTVSAATGTYSGTVTANAFSGDGGDLTGLNIPAGFTELDAALFN